MLTQTLNRLIGTVLPSDWQEFNGEPDQPAPPENKPSKSLQERFGIVGSETDRRRGFLRLLEVDEHTSRLAETGERFARRCVLNDRSKGFQLVLHGPCGTGKSHVAKAVAKFIESWAVDMCCEVFHRTRAVSVFRRDWPKLAAMTKDEDFHEAISDLASAYLVVLDDVGAETDKFKTGLASDRLRRVLGECEFKWLLITTNVPKPQWSQRFDERVASRFSACRHFDTAKIHDYRPNLSKPT